MPGRAAPASVPPGPAKIPAGSPIAGVRDLGSLWITPTAPLTNFHDIRFLPTSHSRQRPHHSRIARYGGVRLDGLADTLARIAELPQSRAARVVAVELEGSPANRSGHLNRSAHQVLAFIPQRRGDKLIMPVPVYKSSANAAASTTRNLRSGVSTVALLSAVFVSSGVVSPAHAADYQAATESDFITAINDANADGDAASTITLTGNVALANPSAIPAITKSLTIDTGSFTLSATGDTVLDAADGETVTLNGSFSGNQKFDKNGGGTAVFTGSSFYSGNYRISEGTVEYRDGAQFNTPVAPKGIFLMAEPGSKASLLVTGSGTILHTGGNTVGGDANSETLIAITNGGRINGTGRLAIASESGGATNTSSVIVSGAGSLLDIDDTISAGFTGDAFFTVTDGGRIQSARVEFGGSTFVNGKSATGVISGKDSTWTSSAQFGLFDGSLSVVDQGQLTAATFDIAAGSGRVAEALISDAGSSITTTGNIRISTSGQGVLTVVQDGKVTVNAGAGTISIATSAAGTGVLNIGGAEGEAARSAGFIEAATIAFGAGDGTVNFNHTNSDYNFAPAFSGAGAINHLGSGKTILDGDSSAFTGTTNVRSGTLSVNGILGGTMNVNGGRLQGIGSVGDTTNFAGGTVAPGNSIGTLTVIGNYAGNGGTLEIESVLGDDASPSDRLVVTGDTSGATNVKVINLGGGGAQTVEGIKIVDVGGVSNGAFSLLGDYVFHGQQVVIGGAYAYTLQKNGIATPADGDWYLRSSLFDPPPDAPTGPIYQPGVPLYEAYPQVLRALNGLPTLQQRVGNRYWEADAVRAPADASAGRPGGGQSAFWARTEGSYTHSTASGSATVSDYNIGQWKARAGLDGLLYRGDSGMLIGGITAHYGLATANVRSNYGDGRIDTTGGGGGGTLTWYGVNGVYVDGQAQATFFDSDLKSDLAGRSMADGTGGVGYAFGAETGRRFGVNGPWALTPQAQLVYSAVDSDFTDNFGAGVSLDRSDSLTGRLGLALDHQQSWRDASGMLARASIYGIANAYYEFLDSAGVVDVAGTDFSSDIEKLSAGFGFGGTYNWGNDKYSVYGEALVKTSLNADYSVGGTAGFRMRWKGMRPCRGAMSPSLYLPDLRRKSKSQPSGACST